MQSWYIFISVIAATLAAFTGAFAGWVSTIALGFFGRSVITGRTGLLGGGFGAPFSEGAAAPSRPSLSS